jgi:hypothetical protein
MDFDKTPWLGSWDNFEQLLYTEEPEITAVWQQVAKSSENASALNKLFSAGAKLFWKKACYTVNEENPVRLQGWQIEDCAQGLRIHWLGIDNTDLGTYDYRLDHMVSGGLEHKPAFVFRAEHADCFSVLVAMPPMEAERNDGPKILAHTHFQFASTEEKLIRNDKLTHTFWYATMDEGNSTLQEKCNLIRALHKLPLVP